MNRRGILYRCSAETKPRPGQQFHHASLFPGTESQRLRAVTVTRDFRGLASARMAALR